VRELVVHIDRVQFASITAASGFLAGWVEVTSLPAVAVAHFETELTKRAEPPSGRDNPRVPRRRRSFRPAD
jgi:hypothetical protein